MPTNYSKKNIRGIDWGIIITVIVTIGSGMFFLGGLNERVNQLTDKVNRIDERISVLRDSLIVDRPSEDSTQNPVYSDPIVFENGKLSSGLDMGVNTSGNKIDWVSIKNNIIKMSYPPNQSWGAVFITVGKPTSSYPRASRNYSHYSKIEIELKGVTGNENVLIGLKDRKDSDDGSETKVRISNLSSEWKLYSLELSQFSSADLSHLHIVTEFVFDGNSETVFVRNIRFRE